MFTSLDEATEFFQAGALGYSPTPHPTRFYGLELHCRTWPLEPLKIEEVHSSYFDDPRRIPPGSIELDSAFLMRNVEHEWHGRADLCCPASRREPVLA